MQALRRQTNLRDDEASQPPDGEGARQEAEEPQRRLERRPPGHRADRPHEEHPLPRPLDLPDHGHALQDSKGRDKLNISENNLLKKLNSRTI